MAEILSHTVSASSTSFPAALPFRKGRHMRTVSAYPPLSNRNPKRLPLLMRISSNSRQGSRKAATAAGQEEYEYGEETVFFDGGAHYGDMVANLFFGFSLLWLPLTVAAVFRGLFLRYRFTNMRVTVISGLTGTDRKDFTYRSVRDVQAVPRLFGEWGDIIITLNDGTKVDLRCVPKFREVADYCLLLSDSPSKKSATTTSTTIP